MFQKLGLKDIFQEIWYRKLVIIALAIVAILISVVDVFVVRDNTPATTEGQTIYTKSILINVSALNKSEFYDSFSQSQKMRNNYVAACQTEFFADYLIKQIEVEDKTLGEMLIPVENEDKKIISTNNFIGNDQSSKKQLAPVKEKRYEQFLPDVQSYKQ